MMFALLLTLAQTGSPNLDQKLSLDYRAVSGKELTIALSHQTGITFDASDTAAFDRFVIHVDNVRLQEAMDRIADAEQGEWLALKGGYRLRRSPTQMAKLRASRTAALAKGYALTLAGFRKELEAQPEFSEQAARELAYSMLKVTQQPTNVPIPGIENKRSHLERQVPINRAFMRVLLTLSPEQLATVQVERPAVLSTRATKMQFELPQAALAELGNLADEETIWDDAVAKYMSGQSLIASGLGTEGRLKTVTTAMLTLQSWSEDSGLNAHLLLADSQDRIISDTYLAVPITKGRPASANGSPEPRIPLSDTDVSLANSVWFDYSDPRVKQPPLTQEARAIASNPERVDPLATFVTNGLLGLAALRHENLVAVVDDRSADEFANHISKGSLDPNVLVSLADQHLQISNESKGWLVISESEPERADEARCDRAAFHRMLNAATAKGRLGIDDAAAYAITSPRFEKNPFPYAYLSGLLDHEGGSVLRQNDSNVLRLYGSLDDVQRAGGSHLLLGRLNAAQIALLERMVYGHTGYLSVDQSKLPLAKNGEPFNVYGTLSREATYCLGAGIPLDGLATFMTSKSSVVMVNLARGDLDQGEGAFEPEVVADLILNTAQDKGPNAFKITSLRVGERTIITFRIQYTPVLFQQMALMDLMPMSPPTATIENLPDAARNAIQAALDTINRQNGTAKKNR